MICWLVSSDDDDGSKTKVDCLPFESGDDAKLVGDADMVIAVLTTTGERFYLWASARMKSALSHPETFRDSTENAKIQCLAVDTIPELDELSSRVLDAANAASDLDGRRSSVWPTKPRRTDIMSTNEDFTGICDRCGNTKAYILSDTKQVFTEVRCQNCGLSVTRWWPDLDTARTNYLACNKVDVWLLSAREMAELRCQEEGGEWFPDMEDEDLREWWPTEGLQETHYLNAKAMIHYGLKRKARRGRGLKGD